MGVTTIAGLIIAAIGIIGGYTIEGGSVAALINIPGFMIVVVGTLGATMVSAPMSTIKAIPQGYIRSMKGSTGVAGHVMAERLVVMADKARREGLLSLEEEAKNVGDVEELTASVEESQLFLEHLQALETERMTALVAISMATGIDPDTATLSQIAAALPSDAAEAVRRTGQVLRAEATALHETQEVNQRLLESSRTLVDRWVNYLRSVLTGGVYTPAGGAAANGGRTLDRSA